MLGTLRHGPAVAVVRRRAFLWTSLGCLVVVTRPAVSEVVATSTAVVNVPVERTPIGFRKDLTEVDAQEALDATKYDLRRHCLKILLEPLEIAIGIEQRNPGSAVIEKVLTYGGTVMRTGPDGSVGEHNETIGTPGIPKPPSKGHAVVGQLREMSGGRLTCDLYVDDAKAQAFVIRTNSIQDTGRRDDPTTVRPVLEVGT